jgi:hypothetical protein
MKRSLSILIVLIVITILSGCFLSKTPETNDVNIPFGAQVKFSVNVFPPGGTFAWTLDGLPLLNMGKSYVYTAKAGEHILTVKATHIFGTDTYTWKQADNCQCWSGSDNYTWYNSYALWLGLDPGRPRMHQNAL